VFLVRDLYLGKELALKLLNDLAPAEETLDHFQKEFTLLAAVEHPGIARAYDFGYLAGRPYFTSEFIAGRPLSARGVVEDAGELLELAKDIARPLAFLHRSGILHLDVKPSNFIARDPRAARPGEARTIIVDFGLCRKGGSASGNRVVRGSLPYMAPECFREGSLGPWTDVYAFGVTVYKLATGCFPRPVAAGAGARSDDHEKWAASPPAMGWSRSRLHADIEKVVLKCLALDPRARFSSAEELLETLDRIERRPASARREVAAVPSTVGRVAELHRLDGFLAAVEVRGDSPPLLFITGPPGMGQTHLLHELKVRAQTRGLRVCLETGFSGLSGPPGCVLRGLAAHMDNAASEARRRWNAFLARLGRPRRPSHAEATEGERRFRRASEVVLAAARIRRPLVLAVDGLQYFDEVSVTLVADLVRHIGEKAAAERLALGVAVGYREEGPFAPLLRELTEYLLRPRKSCVLSLGPLSVEETVELHRRFAGRDDGRAHGLTVFQETEGCPARVAALAAGAAAPRAERGSAQPALVAPAIDGRSRRVLLVLDALGRPARVQELSGLLGTSPSRLRRDLESLRGARLARERDPTSRAGGWIADSAARLVTAGAPAAARRRAHAWIARALASRRSRGPAEVQRLAEAVRHFDAAGLGRDVVRYGLLAARRLKSVYQSRAALAVLCRVLAFLPATATTRRVEVALQVADLHSRIGGLDDGIRILRDAMSLAPSLPAAARARAVLHLAVLHHRRGDPRRADLLFRQGFELAEKASDLKPEEVLHFVNERAAMKAVLGEEAECLKLCAEGLDLSRGARSRHVREVELNLHATRASVALRRHDFAAALVDLETALKIAEAVGSLASRAVILNYLGVIHNQCDRYLEAARAFREAEEICLGLDEGPSLASIYGNLAILHAKTGDFAAMERALAEGERLDPAWIGRRQEFFLEHARGFCCLQRGRYAEARGHLEAAVRLGQEVGDRHVVGFDEVYRAEAFIFEGAYAEADRELVRLSAAGSLGRTRKMALARKAFLAALIGRPREAEEARRAHQEACGEPAVPFLDAWEGLFLGWSSAILGRSDEALRYLEPAERFFRDRGLLPALSLLEFVRRELELVLAGGTPLGTGLAKPPAPPCGDLAAVSFRLLEARALLDCPPSAVGRSRAADVLAEAGALLVGNPLPEWELRLEALRASLQPEPRPFWALVERRRKDLPSGIPEGWRRGYLRSRYWKAWLPPGRRGQETGSRSRGRAARMKSAAETPTAEIHRRTVAPWRRAGLIAKSPRMRRLVALLDRLRGADLPVLISGETGSGKELVARVLHGESARAERPFQVVDVATIPPPLFEAELFGARAGAFTGLTRDRSGILSQAQGGTVFLDEVAGIPLEAQAKLLRVLAEGTVRPLGATAEERIDVRFLFSSARDVELEVREGRLRADFAHRIRVVTLEVPPLRERPEDVADLARAFLSAAGEPVPVLRPGAADRLRSLPWPGNVRELKNLMARLRIEHPEVISVDAVDHALSVEPGTASLVPGNVLAAEGLGSLKDRLEREYIAYHFERLGGDTPALCRLLGLSRRQLHRRCERLGIRLRELRRGIV
jgi:two-component system NtrC family response regulator